MLNVEKIYKRLLEFHNLRHYQLQRFFREEWFHLNTFLFIKKVLKNRVKVHELTAARVELLQYPNQWYLILQVVEKD